MVSETRSREILDAIRLWTERYGDPPTLADWEPSRARARGQQWRVSRFRADDWPTLSVVRYHFGSMGAAIAAAGLQGRRRPTRVRGPVRSKDSLLDAIRAWVAAYGETPTMADWDPPRARQKGQWWRVARYYEGDWPSAASVRHHFGSLNAAVEEAGFEPRPRGRRSLPPQGVAGTAELADVSASIVVMRIRAVSQARECADRVALARALKDLSSACLNWADRLAA